MRESEIEKAFCEALERCGGMQRKFTSPGNSGVPDRICVFDGLVFLVEFKAPGNEPDPLQREEIYAWRQQGVWTVVVDCLESAEGFLATMLDERWAYDKIWSRR